MKTQPSLKSILCLTLSASLIAGSGEAASTAAAFQTRPAAAMRSAAEMFQDEALAPESTTTPPLLRKATFPFLSRVADEDPRIKNCGNIGVLVRRPSEETRLFPA